MSENNYAEVNGLNMFYIEKGKGHPLIFLHGGISVADDNWGNQIDFFSKYFKVIAPDSRGHGRTNNPTEELSYKLMADDIAALIQALNLTNPFIVGWSDGGQIALEIGINYPKLAKALVAGGVLSEISDYYVSTMKFWGIEGPGNVDFEKLREVIPVFAKKLPDIHAEVYGPEYWKKLLQDISKMWLDPSEFPGKKIEQIKVPTLILAGDRDAAISIEEAMKMYKLIPNAELAIIPNADHDVSYTKPDLFNNMVLEFLTRHKE
ncbi:MAG: alpha/beta hydrolase [Candidatus Heimdallarchaeota archaeon]